MKEIPDTITAAALAEALPIMDQPTREDMEVAAEALKLLPQIPLTQSDYKRTHQVAGLLARDYRIMVAILRRKSN